MILPRALRAFAALAFLGALFAAAVASEQNTEPMASPVSEVAAALPAKTTQAAAPEMIDEKRDQHESFAVLNVVDGDTIDVLLNGTTTRLRLIGMDTPETVDPRKPVQCFGREASAKAHMLLDGKRVRLEYDDVAGTYDKYGRALAYVFLPDGTFYNKYMIAEGYAHEYDYQNQPYKYRDELRAAQTSARSAHKGFWAEGACAGNTTKPAAST